MLIVRVQECGCNVDECRGLSYVHGGGSVIPYSRRVHGRAPLTAEPNHVCFLQHTFLTILAQTMKL